MASKRRLRRRGCECKTPYESKAIAEARAKHTGARAIESYECKFCHHYHIGHKPTPKTSRQSARSKLDFVLAQ